MPVRQKISEILKKMKLLPKPARIAAGFAFVLMGLVGFLPVLGFWMVPAGLAILAIDFPLARTLVRRMMTAFNRWRRQRRAA